MIILTDRFSFVSGMYTALLEQINNIISVFRKY